MLSFMVHWDLQLYNFSYKLILLLRDAKETSQKGYTIIF